jgi:hypothetical protein
MHSYEGNDGGKIRSAHIIRSKRKGNKREENDEK